MLPISINELIRGNTVESNRIEFKEGWNPVKVMHTICAFANDIEGVSGGYVVIGIKEVGSVVSDIVGLSDAEIAFIQDELLRLSSFFRPAYFPIGTIEEFEGRKLFVIRALASNERPVSYPRNALDDKVKRSDNLERAIYIRRTSHTVEAKESDLKYLNSVSERYPFDNMVNNSASITDLRSDLISDYLARSGSSYAGQPITLDVMRGLQIVRGPSEEMLPVNVGLMMFSDDPEKFFPYCRIEVVYKPDPTGEGMIENVFKGPVDGQLRRALDYIKSVIISEKIFKLDNQAEAIRVFNYPFAAVEEMLVNAVFHRDFMSFEPVVVTFTSDRMEILTHPGPDMSISDEQIANLELKSNYCRNRRLGDFLKDLRLTEKRNTGMEKIKRAVEFNGSPLPSYETDSRRGYLRITLPIHERFRPARPEGQDGKDLESRIVSILAENGCLSVRDIADRLSVSNKNRNLRETLSRMLSENKVSYLHPENPRHRDQRICLSRSGRGF